MDENNKLKIQHEEINKNKRIAELIRDEISKQESFSDISINDLGNDNGISTKDFIDDSNNKFLLNVLSPEISKNEEKKRIHKDKLINMLTIFLAAQFLMIFLIVSFSLFSIIDCHKKNNPLDLQIIQIIFGFASAYITSVVVELIAILKYIVVNVFDTSIAGLVEIFKNKT